MFDSLQTPERSIGDTAYSIESSTVHWAMSNSVGFARESTETPGALPVHQNPDGIAEQQGNGRHPVPAGLTGSECDGQPAEPAGPADLGCGGHSAEPAGIEGLQLDGQVVEPAGSAGRPGDLRPAEQVGNAGPKSAEKQAVYSKGDVNGEHTRMIEALRRDNRCLQGEELQRSLYLQQTLINLSRTYVTPVPRAENQTVEQYLQAQDIAVRQHRDRLKMESEARVFGPASREAFKLYVDWIQRRAVPSVIRTLDALQLPIPPGCPMTLPADSYQRRVTPALYEAMAESGELSLNLNLIMDCVPSETQLVTLDNTYRWLATTNRSVETALRS